MQNGGTKSSVQRRAYDSSGRRADARARQLRVVEAARKLFLERGYGATSIADIATSADVSVQFVYANFASKASLLARAIDIAVAGDETELAVADRPEYRTSLSAPDLGERVRAVVHLARTAHQRAAPLIHLVQSARGTDATLDRLADTLDAALRQDVRRFVQRLPARMRRHDLGEDEIADLLYTLAAARTWTTLTQQCGWTPDEYEARMADSVHRLLQP
jgi:AcrR family transcriptional regulator